MSAQKRPKAASSIPVAVVGVGASAGGLEALRVFFANLPADTPFAFVVAQHLSPTHQSMLVPLLARETVLPVSEIAQGQEPERGHVYVTPARCNVLLGDGRLQLTEALEPGHPKPSVDEFFISLAGAMADRAIGIVLSGTGSDGARGIRAIRGAGGLTLAQDEGSARYGGMPRAAMDTGCVDHVLAPDQMASRLSELAMPGGGAHRAPELPEATRSIDRIYSLVRARTGTDLDSYKDTTVQRRLRRRMSACSVNSVEEYERLLLDNPEEVQRLAREVLISVTSFFRDTEPFLALEQFVAEVVARKSEGEEVRVWVPGCATGEEPYSIAMLFAAALDAARKDLRVQIFATDVDHQALARARRGLYPAKEVGAEPHALVRRYCSHSDLHYQVSKRVREMLVFSAQDLTRDPPFLRLDLISCRNVLIYFRPQVQSRILHTLAFALRPGGLLFLGRSEATHVEPGLFATIDEKAHLYRRSESAQVSLPGPATTPRLTPALDRGLGRDRPNGPSLGERIFEAMQGAWIGAGVVVDEQLEIQHVMGDVSPFLRMPQGKPELNIAALAIDPLRMELRSALFRSQRGEARSVVQVVRAPSLAGPVGIAVLPVPPQAGLPALFLVRFEQLAADVDTPGSTEADPRDGSIRALEDQLAATREHLQTVIEQLETANEELQSLNEELSSANEELQSTNEEMETANEELQSTNEELTTVNEELEAKTHELTVLNNDLRNVKDSLDFPLVVVDEFQRVSLFNPAARSVFELDDAALGQLLLSIPCRVDAAPLGAALRTIAETGAPSMFQIDAERSYAVHVRPYLDDRHQRRGAVITFIDNTDIRRAGRDLRESNERLEAAQRFSTATLDALPEHICVLDARGEIVAVNAAWLRFSQQNADGGRDCGIGGNYLRVCERAASTGDREAGIFLEGLRAVMHGTAPFFALEYPCHSPSEQRWFEAHVAPFAGDGPRFVVVSHENVTARRLTEERLMLQSRALDSSINGILIADARAPDFPLLYVNRAFEELTGYEAHEVLGRNCRFLHADDTEQPGLRTVRECLHDFHPGRALLRNYRKDGTLFWNELSLYPVPGADGAPAYMVGIQIDKTALIASEEALSQSLEREKRTLAFAGVGTFDWEIRSGRIALSEANRALFGLSLAGDVDYPALRARVHEDDRPVFDDAVRVCLAGHGNLDVEFRVNWPDATVHWLHVKGSVEADLAGMPQRLLCLCQDITQRREADERVRFVAQHDVLTGLPNRALLRDRLQHALGNARRRHERVAVLFIDLDRFKDINDSLGHEVGDRLLQSVANRLRGCVRETDTVCRQGGDEYIVVLPGIRDSNEAAHVATKVLEALSLAHRIELHELSVTPSIGVSVYPDDGENIDVLVRNADSAMYHAKGAGRANFQFFTPEMNERALHKVAMVNELRHAIAQEGLVLHYQPQFRVDDRCLVGFEALVRWHHPARGLLLPNEFIPVAEESDLIRDLGAWVVREVCRQQRRWLDLGLTCVPVAVNVSPLQLRTRDIIEEITGALHDSGVDGSLLELEVTESGVMHDPVLAAEMISALQRLDIRVAIDDFGTGHSSLAQLRRFHIQKLKIDRSFVIDLPGDDDAAAIARAIITLARSLKLDVVAEGVEETGQLDFLLGEGCGTYQGFLASHPLPVQQAEALLAA